jgi:hypothetical protein
MEKRMTNASAIHETARPTLHHVGLTTVNAVRLRAEDSLAPKADGQGTRSVGAQRHIECGNDARAG